MPNAQCPLPTRTKDQGPRPVSRRGKTQGLSGVYQRPVVDMTALEGRFDFDLSVASRHVDDAREEKGHRTPSFRAFSIMLAIRSS